MQRGVATGRTVRACMRTVAAGGALLAMAWPALGDTYEAMRERRPELFHADTGYRLEHYRAAVPDDVPAPVRRVDTKAVVSLSGEGAVLVDVLGALRSRFDELDGTWLVPGDHLTLPGATWLPEVGRGTIPPELERYLQGNLETLTKGDPKRAVVVFCVSDCWMSWNAAQRIAALGYTNVHWYPRGSDGWRDAGHGLVPAVPVPVDVD